ncbi:hypothetical protein F66182_5051 [Fusarium sp. NRRL 66182]|nr:hypothetical protein F66182_5051 [Fusarium sp. NRRL 66182]
MAQLHINNLYRVWFTWVDPLILIPTVYALIFTPEIMLDSLIPLSISPYNADQGFFFHQLAALYAFVGMILAGVLRASSDIKVWRIVIGAVLLVDLSILVSVYVSIEQQGRMDLAKLRWQDWGNLVFTGWVAVLRSLFLAGVGVGDGNNKTKKGKRA